MIQFAPNCSTLFREAPFLQRFERARAAGFRFVESWWPFAGSTPTDVEATSLSDALATASVRYACINLYAGDLGAGERGVLNNPARQREFRASVAAAVALSLATGCRRFNALYGLDPETPSDAWNSCAIDNLAFACDSLASVGAGIVIEPLCRNPRYALRTADAVLAVVASLARGGHHNAGLLADLYQLAFAESDVPRLIRDHADAIWHVQVADDPGRGAPGTGQLPLFAWLDTLASNGYSGVVGLEYLPISGVDPFAWIERWSGANDGAGRSAPAIPVAFGASNTV